MPYTQTDIIAGSKSGHVKVMLGGPPKGGKTTTVLKTSPTPIYVVNADPGGLTGAAREGAVFDFDDVFTFNALKSSLAYLRKEHAKYKTVVIDSFTWLAKNLENEAKSYGRSGYELWGPHGDTLLAMALTIVELPVHAVIIAHLLDSGNDAGSFGVLPAVGGQSKVLVPALAQDWLWLEVTPGKTAEEEPKREFLLGPQGNWKHGCRSIKSVGRMEANITEFIKRAGLQP